MLYLALTRQNEHRQPDNHRSGCDPFAGAETLYHHLRLHGVKPTAPRQREHRPPNLAGTAGVSGARTNLGASPSKRCTAADVTGTGTTPTAAAGVRLLRRHHHLHYTTAATGGISNGTVTLAVPAGLNLLLVTTATTGCTSASTGTGSTSDQLITELSGVTLAGAGRTTGDLPAHARRAGMALDRAHHGGRQGLEGSGAIGQHRRANDFVALHQRGCRRW